MSRFFGVALFVFVLAVAACSDFEWSERGAAGQPCFSDGRCLTGYICSDGMCVFYDGFDDDDNEDDGDAVPPDEYSESPGNDADVVEQNDDSEISDTDTTDPYACVVGEYCWPVPHTGQDRCFNEVGSTACPGFGEPYTGQDAQYIDDDRRHDYELITGDVTLVYDGLTKLTWMRNIDSGRFTLEDAGTYCDARTAESFGGIDDWRLPTRHELLSILFFDAQLSDPLIDLYYFHEAPSDTFWTQTAVGNSQYDVDFSGEDQIVYGNPDEKHCVRCVSSPWKYSEDRQNTRWREVSREGDMVVQDVRTGLVWIRGPIQNESEMIVHETWEAALDRCEMSNYAGRSDWRLPDVNEMISIMVHGVSPEHATDMPGMHSAFYWTSTTNAKDVSAAWVAGYKYGLLKVSMQKGENENSIQTICVSDDTG